MKLRIRRKPVTAQIDATPRKHSDEIVYAGAWSPDLAEHDIATSASHALIGAVDETYGVVKACLTQARTSTQQPINIGHNKHLTWATWHHGREYETFWFGDVTALLHYAHITDTEREQLMLNARKAASRGQTAYATARAITVAVPSKPQINLTDVGLIFTAPII